MLFPVTYRKFCFLVLQPPGLFTFNAPEKLSSCKIQLEPKLTCVGVWSMKTFLTECLDLFNINRCIFDPPNKTQLFYSLCYTKTRLEIVAWKYNSASSLSFHIQESMKASLKYGHTWHEQRWFLKGITYYLGFIKFFFFSYCLFFVFPHKYFLYFLSSKPALSQILGFSS